jgi:hypothetical protein
VQGVTRGTRDGGRWMLELRARPLCPSAGTGVCRLWLAERVRDVAEVCAFGRGDGITEILRRKFTRTINDNC